MILYPYQITVWLWFVIKIRPCQARPHNIIVYTLLTNIQITATVLKLQPAFQGTKPLYRSSLIKLSHSNFHEQRWLAVFRFCILLFIFLKKLSPARPCSWNKVQENLAVKEKRSSLAFKKNVIFWFVKEQKLSFFRGILSAIHVVENLAVVLLFFGPSLKETDEKGKTRAYFGSILHEDRESFNPPASLLHCHARP